MDKEDLIREVMDAAYTVHIALVPGYLESVYHNALLVELRDRGLECESEKPLTVMYHDVCVGEFKADIVVDGRLVLELKAVSQLLRAHEAQLVNYLTITGIDDGLLINFGSDKIEIKRKYRERKDIRR